MEVYDLVDWALAQHRLQMLEIRMTRTPTTLEELGTIWAIGGEILDRAEAIRERRSWRGRLRRWFRAR